ncbi:Uncharacterized protein YR821_3063 [Yersinia ruckeri]|uniref:Uncharacterized protein n=1 Tax=Yersinia ruckeri TaxID=29486 RepID=A0A0A8VMQ8_YERRU|nr:hypothetical protein CS534_08240 [Yersinia ruckeri]QTD77979.1 Uncharacterized protein YR821_3063 [Yersinia ruckeri]CEK28896.1 hypothetical protein CSF007_15870 [Yersinia ruckeri]
MHVFQQFLIKYLSVFRCAFMLIYLVIDAFTDGDCIRKDLITISKVASGFHSDKVNGYSGYY